MVSATRKLVVALLCLATLIHPSTSTCYPGDTFMSTYGPYLNGMTLSQIRNPSSFVGQGSFGSVFKIRFNNKPAALKIVKSEKSSDKKSALKEENVMQILRNVDGTVKIRACLFDNDRTYFIEDWLYKTVGEMGSTVRSWDVLGRLKLYRRMAEILRNVHLAGVIHNDMKPDNFMFVDSSLREINLIDFGESCFNYMNEYCTGGSPVFDPPEKVLSHGNGGKVLADPKIDVWAFLIGLAVLEDYGSLYNLRYDQTQNCYTERMSSTCYSSLMGYIDKMMNGSPQKLREYVKSSLKIDAAKRPDMLEIMRKLDELIRDEESGSNKNTAPVPYVVSSSSSSAYDQPQSQKRQIFTTTSTFKPSVTSTDDAPRSYSASVLNSRANWSTGSESEDNDIALQPQTQYYYSSSVSAPNQSSFYYKPRVTMQVQPPTYYYSGDGNHYKFLTYTIPGYSITIP